MLNNLFSTLAVAAIFNFLSGANGYAQQSSPLQKNILILSISGTGEPFVYALTSSLQKNLHKDEMPTIRFLYESVALPTISSHFKREELKKWLRTKYAYERIDAILTIGYAPLNFALENRGSLWRDAPIVFTAVPRPVITTLDISDNVTGISSNRSMSSIVHLIKRVFPRAERVVLIGDQIRRVDYRSYFIAEVSDASDTLPITDLRGEHLESIIHTLRNLPPSSIVYFTRFTDDGSGSFYSSESVLRYLAGIVHAPIFVDNQTLMIDGVFGSSAVDIKTLALSTAQILEKIFQIGNARDLPPQTQQDTLEFNWQELKRWSVPISRVPEGSIILNYEKTFVEQYKTEIVVYSIAFAFLLFLIVALLFERRSRTAAVKRSRKYLNEIAHINRNTTASVYAATIAHEMNQPLAALSANTDTLELYLEREPPLVAEAKSILSDIRNDEKRATELIKKLRKMAKKEENKLVPVNMVQIVHDTLKFLAPELKMRRTRVVTLFSSSSLWANGDPIQLQQVLTNLIINSLDAMSGLSSLQKKVSIDLLADERYITVTVKDTGTGFEADIDKIFESFFTTKNHGLGLGLAITASIIEDHGGYITAANAEDQGAVVQFSLPLLNTPLE